MTGKDGDVSSPGVSGGWFLPVNTLLRVAAGVYWPAGLMWIRWLRQTLRGRPTLRSKPGDSFHEGADLVIVDLLRGRGWPGHQAAKRPNPGAAWTDPSSCGCGLAAGDGDWRGVLQAQPTAALSSGFGQDTARWCGASLSHALPLAAFLSSARGDVTSAGSLGQTG